MAWATRTMYIPQNVRKLTPTAMGANPAGATGAIAPPRICQEGLNIA